MTGTVVDSAAKHIRQCKVNTDIMSVWATCDQQAMHQNRYKYITHKDDLVLNVTQKIGRALSTNKLDVYPSVVSNFADMDKNTQCAMMWLYDSSSPKEFIDKVQLISKSSVESVSEIKKWAGSNMTTVWDEDTSQLTKTLSKMPYLQAQGYAQTVGYATPISGDTVLSVLIGGLVTVRNGHFPMRCGQAVQWYFNFEKDSFSSQHTSTGLNEWDIGSRLPSREGDSDDSSLTDRRGKLEGHPKRILFALPKPYVISSQTGDEFYGDKIRVFARCIGGGGPHEMVDLQLMTQSL
jgi:hypothetical protein